MKIREAKAIENKIKRYESYKDSGVEWLGEIPEGWEVRRIKYLFNEINDRSEDGKEDLLSVSQYTGVTNKTDKLESGGMLTNALTLEGYKKVSEGDLVSNIMLAWNGSLGFSPFNGITSPAYSIYRIIGDNHNRFFHYLFRTELYKSEFKRNSSGVIESRLRLYTDDFFDIEAILPSVLEQSIIAEFLDDKTTKIDEAIGIKEKQIRLLKERKQILIHKAVTRGLDDNVALKDSGVEWIGEIPEGWEVKRLKFTSKLVSEKVSSKESQLEYIGMENIESWTGKFIPSDSETEGLANYFGHGDVLFGKLRPYLAKVYLAEKEGICSTEFLIYRTDKTIFNWYLKLIMLSFEFINLIDSSTYGSKMPRANSDFIEDQLIPIPPLSEQKEISIYIEVATGKIETAIGLKQQEIEKMKEYKSSLINGVVTGKVKIF
jgi:type I restriction enzyme S subunit